MNQHVQEPASAGIDGYLAQDVYPSHFAREFTPAWVDAVLRRRGVAPPRTPREPFSLLDLGCGDGAQLVVMAAAYPEGRFVGVDAMPAHVAHGQAFAERAGVTNVSFRCALFADIEDTVQPEFDYVTAQGVIAWVSAANRERVYKIAGNLLKPGGVAVLGYNTMPGWKNIAVFQHMVLAMAATEAGTPDQGFDAAVQRLRALGAAGAPGFGDELWDWFDGVQKTIPSGYFAHEYLNDHWTPHWSDQVAGAMAAHSFTRATLANANRQREDFTFRAAERRAMAEIGDPVARELAADVFFNASFRIDVFARAGRPGAAEPRLDGWWAATVAEADVEYACNTRAGRLKFDNAAAHAILAALGSGPKPLRAIHERGGAGTEADVLNAADALFAAGYIAPAEPPAATPFADALNADVAEAAAQGVGARALAGPYGAFGPTAAAITEAVTGDAAAIAGMARLGIDVPR